MDDGVKAAVGKVLMTADIINGLRSGMVTIVDCPEHKNHFALQINYSTPRIFSVGFETKLNAIRTYWRLKLPNNGIS